jgi:uncharacterized protein (TIGR02996 family)
MRSFTFDKGRTHRFWNIILRETSFTTSSGTTGRGVVTTARFGDEKTTKAEYDRLVAEKLAEGYIETTNQPLSAGFDSPLRAALEAALFENPDDRAAHMAYADHLMELGDPRGEFIQTQLALEDESLSAEQRKALRKREKALLRKHERTWLGALAGYWIDRLDGEEPSYGYEEPNELTWSRGWVDSLTFYDGSSEPTEAALRSTGPLFLLRELRLDNCDYDYDCFSSELIAADFFGNVRILQVGRDPGNGSAECYFSSSMDAEEYVKKMPRLEELRLFARQASLNTLFARSMPNLRKLSVYHFLGYPLKVLAKNRSLGNLTHLTCWPRGQSNDGDGVAYITPDDFTALVRSTNLPKLQHLQLCLTDFGDKSMVVLVKSGILKRLKTLNLHGGTVTDVGAQTLADCPDLRNLESLRLSDNYLTRAGIEALRATGVKMVAGRQNHESYREDHEHLNDGDCE